MTDTAQVIGYMDDIEEIDRRRFEMEGLKVFSTEYIKMVESGRPAKFMGNIVALDRFEAERYLPEGHTLGDEIVGIIPAVGMDEFIASEQTKRDGEWENEATR